MKIIFVLIGLLLATARFAGASDSCLTCHSDAERMSSLGAAALTVTGKEVEKQSSMLAGCSDCHLGNPDANEQDKAHAGLARLLVVRKKGLTADSSLRRLPLQYGTNPANRIYVGIDRNGTITRDASVVAVSWHDKRRDTLTQDFDVLKKTCGKCHEKEFTEFSRSTMGTNGKQSQYKGFLDPRRGPHNCGPWFEGNFERMQATTSVPMSRKSSLINQKACNTCHVGCLDCHFNPGPKVAGDQTKGAHSFVKTPPSESCYGSGRASICHAGPEDRRRGAGYFGGSFSYPEGNEADVHIKAGYQGTYWGPGKLAGVATPYFKFKAYYGYMSAPILIKNQKGRWIPVKPFPMATRLEPSGDRLPGSTAIQAQSRLAAATRFWLTGAVSSSGTCGRKISSRKPATLCRPLLPGFI